WGANHQQFDVHQPRCGRQERPGRERAEPSHHGVKGSSLSFPPMMRWFGPFTAWALLTTASGLVHIELLMIRTPSLEPRYSMRCSMPLKDFRASIMGSGRDIACRLSLVARRAE